MTRRLAVMAAVAGWGCGVVEDRRPEVQSSVPKQVPAAAPVESVPIVDISPAGEPTGPVEVTKVILPDEAWAQRLSPLAFSVTRRKGTELAFTGKYNKHYEPGVYRCVACNTALFHSRAKFDSGTGWPSFYDTIAKENVYTGADTSMAESRDEVLCRRCDSHLGHVFPDGPEPTGLRYCMNSAALTFQALP